MKESQIIFLTSINVLKFLYNAISVKPLFLKTLMQNINLIVGAEQKNVRDASVIYLYEVSNYLEYQ